MSDASKDAARERVAAVAFIASLVGHKARNRLALVRAGLELLQMGAESALTPEHRAELLAQLDSFLADFNLGIDMIRCDFGRIETGSLVEIVSESVDTFRPHAEKAGIAASLALAGGADAAPEAWPIDTDRRLVRLVLLNLLRNAEQAGARTVVARLARSGENYVVSVEDDGEGVAADVLPKLFLEPVTNRADGTGLGLLLCRDSLQVLGGAIRHAPAPSGSRFEVLLPRRS